MLRNCHSPELSPKLHWSIADSSQQRHAQWGNNHNHIIIKIKLQMIFDIMVSVDNTLKIDNMRLRCGCCESSKSQILKFIFLIGALPDCCPNWARNCPTTALATKNFLLHPLRIPLFHQDRPEKAHSAALYIVSFPMQALQLLGRQCQPLGPSRSTGSQEKVEEIEDSEDSTSDNVQWAVHHPTHPESWSSNCCWFWKSAAFSEAFRVRPVRLPGPHDR